MFIKSTIIYKYINVIMYKNLIMLYIFYLFCLVIMRLWGSLRNYCRVLMAFRI